MEKLVTKIQKTNANKVKNMAKELLLFAKALVSQKKFSRNATVIMYN